MLKVSKNNNNLILKKNFTAARHVDEARPGRRRPRRPVSRSLTRVRRRALKPWHRTKTHHRGPRGWWPVTDRPCRRGRCSNRQHIRRNRRCPVTQYSHGWYEHPDGRPCAFSARRRPPLHTPPPRSSVRIVASRPNSDVARDAADDGEGGDQGTGRQPGLPEPCVHGEDRGSLRRVSVRHELSAGEVWHARVPAGGHVGGAQPGPRTKGVLRRDVIKQYTASELLASLYLNDTHKIWTLGPPYIAQRHA